MLHAVVTLALLIIGPAAHAETCLNIAAYVLGSLANSFEAIRIHAASIAWLAEPRVSYILAAGQQLRGTECFEAE